MRSIAAIIAASDTSLPSAALASWQGGKLNLSRPGTVQLFFTTYLLLHYPYYLPALGDVHSDFVKACYDLASNTLFSLMDLSLSDRTFRSQMTPEMTRFLACLSCVMVLVLKSGTELRSDAVWQHDNYICESRQYLTCLFRFWNARDSSQVSGSMRWTHDKHLCADGENCLEPFSVNLWQELRKRTALSGFGTCHVGHIDNTTNEPSENVIQVMKNLSVCGIPAPIGLFSKSASDEVEYLSVSIAHAIHMRKVSVPSNDLDSSRTYALCEVLKIILLHYLPIARSENGDLLRDKGSTTCSEDQLHEKVSQRWSNFTSIWWFMFPYFFLNHVMKVDALLETMTIIANISPMARNGAILLASPRSMLFTAATINTTLRVVHVGVAFRNTEAKFFGLPHMESLLKFVRYVQKWHSGNNDSLPPRRFGDEWLLLQVRSVETQQLTQEDYLLCQELVGYMACSQEGMLRST